MGKGKKCCRWYTVNLGKPCGKAVERLGESPGESVRKQDRRWLRAPVPPRCDDLK